MDGMGGLGSIIGGVTGFAMSSNKLNLGNIYGLNPSMGPFIPGQQHVTGGVISITTGGSSSPWENPNQYPYIGDPLPSQAPWIGDAPPVIVNPIPFLPPRPPSLPQDERWGAGPLEELLKRLAEAGQKLVPPEPAVPEPEEKDRTKPSRVIEP